MAQLWTTGPAFLYVGVGANYAPYELGTDEASPTMDIAPAFEPIANDIGGSDPLDDTYMGKSARIDYAFNRWNENVLAAIEKTNPFSLAARGRDDPGDVGSIMQLEGKAFPVWVVFSFALTSPFAAMRKAAMAGLPAGYRFPSCTLVRDNHNRLGTRNKRTAFTFQARRLYANLAGDTSNVLTAQTGNAGVSGASGGGNNYVSPLIAALPNLNLVPGGFLLYDHDMTGVTLPN